MRKRTFITSLAVLALAVPMSLLAPSAASARGEAIDPLTLNPPLTHGGPVCTWRGDQIVCQSSYPQPQDAFTIPSGIICDGAELEWTLKPTLEHAVATYNSNRDIVSLLYVESWTGSFLNPDTGKSAAWTQKDRLESSLTTPGNPFEGTSTFNGQQQVRTESGRVILTDAGVETFDIATTTRLSAVGHHPIDDFFYGGDPAGLAPLCKALT
jgi:hypothetical protein